MLLVAVDKPYRALRFVVGQHARHFHVGDGAGGVVVGAGRGRPALRVFVRDNDYMLVGVARARFFGVEVVGGIPGVVGFGALELVRHRAR